MENLNSKDWPEVYSAKFLEAGIVSYEDSGAGIALLKKETIDNMAHTFIGRPVIIDHQNVTPENFEKAAVGYVTNVRFNSSDGWFYADFIVTNDKAKQLIDDKGYSVSCAYNVLDVAEGGLWHDIKYDGEITEGSFTHLALVESPRYEDSKITKQLPAMLVNGKVAHYLNNQEESEMSIFKLFKKTENDKTSEDILAKYVEIDSKAVPVGDVILSCLNGKKLVLDGYSTVNEKQKYVVKDEDIVDINGNSISIGDLKASYAMKTENEKKNCSCGAKNGTDHKEDCTFFSSKKNEVDGDKDKDDKAEEKKAQNAKEEDEAKAKAKADEEAKNAKDEEEKKAKEAEEAKNAKEEEEIAKAEEEEKKNAKAKSEAFFNELSNVGKKFEDDVENGSPAPRTRQERANAFREKTSKRI